MPTPSEAALVPISRLFRRGQVVLVLALLALYLPTLASGPTFSDGPELVTAIWTLGVPHPTGYPLFALVGHAFTRILPIPVSPCVKVELFNVLCALGAALFTARAVRELTLLLQIWGSPGAHAGAGTSAVDADVAGLVSAFLLGIAHLVWEQVRIPEVYPLHLFLVTWAGRLWVRYEVTRRAALIAAAAVPMGLGLAHHVTMVYFLPAAAIYLLLRLPGLFVGWLGWLGWLGWPVARIARRWRPGIAAWSPLKDAWVFPVACVIGALPLLSYGYLIWANAHTTGVPWNDVNGWDRLVYHVSGKQYSGFFGGGELAGYLGRIRRIPGNFDRQFLPAGTLLLLVGLGTVFRRAARIGVLFAALLLFNVAHGIYYAVGDYANYFIPALFPCVMFMGAGLWWLLRAARARPLASRRWMALAATAVMALGYAVAVVGYAQLTKRVPAIAARAGGVYVGVPLALIGVGAALGAIAAWRARAGEASRARQLGPAVLPAVLLAGLAATFVPVSLSRASSIGDRVEVGGSYGAEVVTTVPRGAVYLTQGDGYLFNMWYQHHVLDQGLDFATLDVGTMHAPWYQRYLRGRYPSSCDPMAPEYASDPAAFVARCGTFAKRMDLGDKGAWVSFGQARPRNPAAARRLKVAPKAAPGAKEQGAEGEGTKDGAGEVAAGAQDAADVAEGDKPAGGSEAAGSEAAGEAEKGAAKAAVDDKVVRGDEPGCVDAEYRKQHADACKCWDHAHRKSALAETCVVSAEEGGIVPRAKVEITIDRLIRSHIDERPVYERNAVTLWQGDQKTNPRGWVGPAYQRPSAEFALVNRGRVNQVVYTADIEALPGCGEILQRVAVRPPLGPRRDPPLQPYQPSTFPILLSASYLSALPEGDDDDARRAFAPGDPVHMRLHWFEQFHYDAARPDRRGAPVRHGVRVCVYDPVGHRVATAEAVSGREERLSLLRTTTAAPEGEYTVQACSVGEVGEGAVPEGAPCKRVLLEFAFTVGSARSREALAWEASPR
ncbi:protein O-mannosyl-transferase family [Chondromyces apiculatus]|uniref:DUF2723 domain-containing protein n=1 Tax=Chondromyces apiculatus DSM 436 TaxID=1192034 RepID=A0A017T2A0_9BACT|nr:DUF2723 domain-containing protein [Chondromyces apiculatus]EYF03394.1 Hypothetical protein CAP_5587 [Chondromyces apiculatus DSM 436]